jgi:F0F1-type ATP synthase epsilon subunit
MAIVINGSGTVTGLAVGGLPDGTVDSGTIATGTIVDADVANVAASKLTGALPAISAANLTAIPAANITGTLPAISGANLTGIQSGVIQVKSATKFDDSSYSVSQTFTDIGGLSVTITPTSTSNKFLIFYNVQVEAQDGQRGGLRITKDNDAIGRANADGDRQRMTSIYVGQSNEGARTYSAAHLNTIDDLNATTFKVQFHNENSTGVKINRGWTDSNNNTVYHGTSDITVMEVLP